MCALQAFGVEDKVVVAVVEWKALVTDLSAHASDRWLDGWDVALALVVVYLESDDVLVCHCELPDQIAEFPGEVEEDGI